MCLLCEDVFSGIRLSLAGLGLLLVIELQKQRWPFEIFKHSVIIIVELVKDNVIALDITMQKLFCVQVFNSLTKLQHYFHAT